MRSTSSACSPIRDERRAAAPDERVDAIVIDRLKDKMMSALRHAIDELGRIDCSKNPALSGRLDAELAWIGAAIETFGGAAQ